MNFLKQLILMGLVAVPVFLMNAGMAEATMITNINLSNASFSSSATGQMTVRVNISNNGDTPQSDVKYGVQLIQTTDKGQSIVDTFVVTEILTLDVGKSLQKEFSYTPPSFLNGKYDLWVISQTTSGLMLGLARAGEITLPASTGNGQNRDQGYMEIISDSCFVGVSGDDRHFTLLEGVDVKGEEILSLHCSVKSHFRGTVGIRPFFENYERSVYGRKADMIYPAQNEIIPFQPDETKELSLVIPKPNKPQAYDVSMTLRDAMKNTVVSVGIVAHYVLRGASATIQNVSLDKANYVKGDTISVHFFWTPSADQFPGSRTGNGTDLPDSSVTLRVVDMNGNTCVEGVTKKLTEKDTDVPIEMSALIDCVRPTLIVGILDSDGHVLDGRTISSPESQPKQKETPPQQEEAPSHGTQNKMLFFIIASGIGILLVGVMVWMVRKKRLAKKNNASLPIHTVTMLLVFVLAPAFFLMSPGRAEAWSDGGLTVNATPPTACPGDVIVLNYSFKYMGCSNTIATYVMDFSLGGNLVTLTTGGGGPTVMGSTPFRLAGVRTDFSTIDIAFTTYFSTNHGGSVPMVAGPGPSGVISIPRNSSVCPLPSSWSPWGPCSASCGGGTQSRTCTGGGAPCSGPSSQACNTQSCVVVNGVCGASHYDCSSGTTENRVDGTSEWSWSCYGSGGGSHALSCSESKVTVGTVNVSSNVSASWTITGPSTINGSGTSQSSPSKPPGSYTITWNPVTGYATPPPETLTLTARGTISFNGYYSNVDLTAAPVTTTPVTVAVPVTLSSVITNIGLMPTPGGVRMTTYSLPRSPLGIAFDGTNMWVTSQSRGPSVMKISSTGGVSLYDFSSRLTRRDYFGELLYLHDIVFDGRYMWALATGNLTYTDIIKFSLDGTFIASYTAPRHDLGGLVFDGVNIWSSVYATYWWQDSLLKVSPTGMWSEYLYSTIPLRPTWLAFDGTNLWVSGSSGVKKISPTTREVLASSAMTSGPFALDGARNTWVFDWGVNKIAKISPTGGVSHFDGVVSSPYGNMVFDGTNMWLANYDENSVTKISPTGEMNVYGGTGSHPYRIAFDGTNIWTTNHNDSSVTKITTGAGSFLNLFQVASAPSGGGTVTTLPPVSISGSMASGATRNISTSYTFPTAGTYSVRACADLNAAGVGTITESNEANNCSAWTNIPVGIVSKTLSVTKNGTGFGSFTMTDGVTAVSSVGINCTGMPCTGTETVLSGGTRVITAHPSFSTVTWTGCTSVVGNVCTVSNIVADTAVTATFTLVSPSVDTLTATPNPVSYNTPSTLTWTASGGVVACYITGGIYTSVDWYGTYVGGATGSVSTGNLIADTPYTVNCHNGAVWALNGKSVTVTVTPTGTLKICEGPFLRKLGVANIPLSSLSTTVLTARYGLGDCSTDPAVSAVWSETNTPDNAISLTPPLTATTVTVTSVSITAPPPKQEDITATYGGNTETARAVVACMVRGCTSFISEMLTYCPTEVRSFDNNCGGTVDCPGIRYCQYDWTEGSP